MLHPNCEQIFAIPSSRSRNLLMSPHLCASDCHCPRGGLTPLTLLLDINCPQQLYRSISCAAVLIRDISKCYPPEPGKRVRVEKSCVAASANKCRSQCHIDVESLSCVFISHSLTALWPWPLILQPPTGYNAVRTTLISTFPRHDENQFALEWRGTVVSTWPSSSQPRVSILGHVAICQID